MPFVQQLICRSCRQPLPEDRKAFKKHCQSECRQWLQDRSQPLINNDYLASEFDERNFKFCCHICEPRHSGSSKFDGCFSLKYDLARHEWNKHKTYMEVWTSDETKASSSVKTSTGTGCRSRPVPGSYLDTVLSQDTSDFLESEPETKPSAPRRRSKQLALPSERSLPRFQKSNATKKKVTTKEKVSKKKLVIAEMDKTVGGTPKKSPKRTVAPPTPLSKQKPAPKRRPSCGRSASHAASPSVRPLPKVTLTVYPASSRSPSPAPQCSIRETRSETPVVPDELGSQIEPLRSETHRSSSMESHGSERESTASASNSTAVASGQQPGAVTSSFERAMHCIRVPMRMSQSAYDENILRGLWYGHCYAADFLAVSPHIRQAALLWYRYVQAHYPELNQDVSAIAGETDPAFWNDTDQIDLCHRLLKVDPIAQPDDMKEMNAVQSALLHRSMQPYRDSHAPLDIPTVYAVSSAMITSGQASPFLGWASSPPHRAELGHMEFGGTPALQHLHPENRTHGSDATTTPRIRASSATPPHVRRGMSNDSQDRREVTFSDNLDHYWFALDNVPYSSLNISDH